MVSMEKARLVFIPLPITSHLVAAVKTAELLVRRDGRLSITFLIMNMLNDSKINSYINNPPHPNINFVHLKQDESTKGEAIRSTKEMMMNFVASHKASARDVVSEMTRCPESGRVAGFVVDIMCVAMIDVAKELDVSSYVFFPSGAAIIGLMFDLQSLCDDRGQELADYEDSDVAVSISTYVNPVPARVWPNDVFDREGHFLYLARKLRGVDGIIVNSFSELESYATDSIFASKRIPRIYTIGPIIGDERVENEESENKRDEILRWLDDHPDSSVVYLCFGSMGAFAAEQVKEIALALEATGARFLWSLKKPISREGIGFPTEYENPDEVLPQGFLERTAGVGKVIGWAPQMTVLSHPAVGGFVSHCGWNSILESVWCGIPMAAWPLGAEQQTNAFQLVKDIGIAVEIKMDYRNNSSEIVAREIISKAIGQLMDPNDEIRVKMKEMKEKSRRALMEEGSSYHLLGCLIDSFMEAS